MTAVEALRQARATVNHDHTFGGVPDGDCHGCTSLVMHPDSPWQLAVDGHDVMGTLEDWHARCASALLDGFAVAEVTRAERKLGR